MALLHASLPTQGVNGSNIHAPWGPPSGERLHILTISENQQSAGQGLLRQLSLPFPQQHAPSPIQTQPPLTESVPITLGAATAQKTMTPRTNAQTNASFERFKAFIINFLSLVQGYNYPLKHYHCQFKNETINTFLTIICPLESPPLANRTCRFGILRFCSQHVIAPVFLRITHETRYV